MSPEERAARAQHIRAIVRENNVVKWLAAQMADIHRKRATRRRRGART
jgi:trehalose-6-phosphate synthase